ncbi:MAG: DMT family transporter, partial [Thermococci archaeon]|nr:DMT family transporter [Thermococci archaeon]
MRRGEAVLLAVTFVWGTTFPLMKVSVRDVPPILFMMYRFGIAALLMLLFYRGRVLRRDTVFRGFMLALALASGNGLQIVGLKYTTAADSAFITSLYVVFTPFLAYFLMGKKIGIRDVISLGAAITGLYLISGATLSLNYGNVLTVLCAVSFAFQIVLIQIYGESDYLSLSFWQILWSFVLFLSYSIVAGPGLSGMSPGEWLAAIYLGIFATFVAFTVQVRYQRETEPHKAAIIYSLEAVFATVLSFVFLGERFTSVEYLGAFLIL